MNFPNVVYTSGANWNIPVAVSAPRFSAPLPGVADNYLFDQDYMCNFNDFALLDLGTPHDEYEDYFLVREGDKAPSGGKVRWTRTYAKIPASYTEPAGSTVYDFVGFWGLFGYNISAINGRPVTIKTVPMMVSHVWYLCEAGQTYETPAEIPLPTPTRYYSETGSGIEVRMLCNAPFTPVSEPTRAAYEALMVTDAADPASYSIVVEARAPVREWGNMFRVDTFMIKAE